VSSLAAALPFVRSFWAQVSWGLLGQICVSWALTLPFAALVAAVVMGVVRAGIDTEYDERGNR